MRRPDNVMKYKLIIISLLFGPFIYIAACNRNKKPDQGKFIFPEKLSAFHLFKGQMAQLIPDSGVHLLELSATLFTDYAEKQRLIKIPQGMKMIITGDGLPVFPEGTLLIKTFYYSKEKTNPVLGRQLVETRILKLQDGQWNAGTYRWTQDQKEAVYTAESAVVPVTSKSNDGSIRKIAYHIPGKQECLSCHQSNNELIPIGPKAMNLNRTIDQNGQLINQLTALQQKGLLNLKVRLSDLTVLPSYEDTTVKLEHRARAYLEINCAHCHNPAGMAYRQSVLFKYQTPLAKTGIPFHLQNIAERMQTEGEFHMPKMGTTVIDKEGVKLIRTWLISMQQQ